MSYYPDGTALIVGVGLMGQFMARHIGGWMRLKRLILVDHTPEILIGDQRVPLGDFGRSVQDSAAGELQVLTEVVDVTSEESTLELMQRSGGIHYWMHTAGVSPRPLTPPEQMTKSDIIGACEINLWGAMNVIKQGCISGGLARGSRGVLVLSTSATVGSEGRASAAYEVSKAGLANLLQLHARYFVETYGLVLNGIAPSPLRGLMAAQNPVSTRRLKAVEDSTPLGGLTEPKHIAAACMYLWARECWCVGEIVTTDGGYTKHRPVFGDLPQ